MWTCGLALAHDNREVWAQDVPFGRKTYLLGKDREKSMEVRITHLDGKLPNIALMKLSHWHKSNGDNVHFYRTARKELFEPKYDVVYGSSIFSFNEKKQQTFLKSFPNAIVGGTGFKSLKTIEAHIGILRYEKYDYKLYPEFENSIGFTQRGCRLKCKFCVVGKKEGANVDNDLVANIWRGDPYPKNLILLDNDFFGQPNWESKANEIIDGNFRACFCQGINIRLIDDKSAQVLPHIQYYDNKFKIGDSIQLGIISEMRKYF